MKLIHPFWEIEDYTADAMVRIERIARTCYKSEEKICEGSADRLVRKLVKKGHTAMLDHAYASVRVICDRGISHEWVRHRIGVGYAQESTRYCCYADDRFDGEVTFIINPDIWPCAEDEPDGVLVQLKGWPQRCGCAKCSGFSEWLDMLRKAEAAYFHMLNLGVPPQHARSVLPNSLKTELVATGTFTYWRHFFALRCAPDAHPQMRQISIPLRDEFIRRWAPAFEDLA